MDRSCPNCGNLLDEGIDICPSCNTPLENDKTQKEAGDKGTEGAGRPEEDDYLDLLEALKEKVKNAQDELEEDLGDELDNLVKRVTGVVESVERIEHIDRDLDDKLLYKEGEGEDQGVASQQPEIPETIQLEESSISEEGGTPEDASQPTLKDEEISRFEDDLTKIEISSDFPYTEIKERLSKGEGGEAPTDTYFKGLDPLLMNLFKLVEIKLNRRNFDEAREILDMVSELAPEDPRLKDNYALLKENQIAAEVEKETKGEKEPPEIESGTTKVLAEGLVESISNLESDASSAISQLERLIESKVLPGESPRELNDMLEEARTAHKQKRFRKANDTALKAIGLLKDKIHDNMDTQTQENVEKARRMVENLAKADIDISDKVLGKIKATFDRALKAYLMNEHEKASLIARNVIDDVNFILEPEGGKLGKRISEIKKTLRSLRDKAFLRDDIDEIGEILSSVEKLISRRAHSDARTLMERVESRTEELNNKSKTYSKALELKTKLNSKLRKLSDEGFEVEAEQRKGSYLNDLFKESRFDDVISLGTEMEESLDGFKESRMEKEAKEIMGTLEGIMLHVGELAGSAKFKRKFNDLRKIYDSRDLETFIDKGRTLTQELSKKIRILPMERSKKIAGDIIEVRILISRLRGLKIDTADFERRARKSKNLIKEKNFIEGIRQLDKLISDMRENTEKDEEFTRRYMEVHKKALMDIIKRHKDDPSMFLINRSKLPLLERMSKLRRFKSTLKLYKDLEKDFHPFLTKDDERKSLEGDLQEMKFEIYKRKDKGMDITEPLSLYTLAQKRFKENKIIPAEYLLEVTRRYCETFLHLDGKKAKT